MLDFIHRQTTTYSIYRGRPSLVPECRLLSNIPLYTYTTTRTKHFQSRPRKLYLIYGIPVSLVLCTRYYAILLCNTLTTTHSNTATTANHPAPASRVHGRCIQSPGARPDYTPYCQYCGWADVGLVCRGCCGGGAGHP